jgi:hypothetical protein
MQFLVIEKANVANGLSPEMWRQVPGILDAIREYNQVLTKAGTVRASFGFADAPGAVYVVEAKDATDLTRILGASPSNAFPLTREVHPVTDVPSNLATQAATVRESIEHQDAMILQQRAASSARDH